METVDAESHGWPLATWSSKQESDSSYKAVLEYALRPEHIGNVRIGVAGHNLFDIALAWLLASKRGGHRRASSSRCCSAWPRRQADGRQAHRRLAAALHAGRAPRRVRRRDRLPDPPPRGGRVAGELHVGGLRPRRGSCPLRAREGALPRVRARRADRRVPAAEPRAGPRSCPTPSAPTDRLREHPRHRPVPRAEPRLGRRDPRPHAGLGRSATTPWPRTRSRRRSRSTPRSPPPSPRARPGARSAPRDAPRSCTAPATCSRRAAPTCSRSWAPRPARSSSRATPRSPRRSTSRTTTPSARRSSPTSTAPCMQPVGLTVVTPPWNFPVAIPAGSTLAALATGSPVIIKPARQARRSGAVMVEALWEAGVPREVLQYVQFDGPAAGSSARKLVSDRGRRPRDPHRRLRDGRTVPRLPHRPAAARRDERQERDHRHPVGRPRPRREGRRVRRVRPRRAEVLRRVARRARRIRRTLRAVPPSARRRRALATTWARRKTDPPASVRSSARPRASSSAR